MKTKNINNNLLLKWRSASWQLKKRLASSSIMLLGAFATYGIIFLTSLPQDVQRGKRRSSVVAFDVPAQETKKSQLLQKQPPKKAPKSQDSLRPNLGNLVSGFNFDGGAYDFSDLGSLNNELLGDQNQDIMTADSVDQAPKAIYTPDMEFPPEARKRGIAGYVIFNLMINDKGQVENAKILESNPPEIFDQVAMSGIRGWRFEPALYKGKSVTVWAKQKIRFELQ